MAGWLGGWMAGWLAIIQQRPDLLRESDGIERNGEQMGVSLSAALQTRPDQIRLLGVIDT